MSTNVDQFGNEIGLRDGTTTWNNRTMQEYLDAGELPAGFYNDPEGVVRQKEGYTDETGFHGFTGTRGFFGANHSLADFQDGVIVRFRSGGGIPGGQGGAGQPQPPYNPNAAQAAKITAVADLQRATAAVVELLGK